MRKNIGIWLQLYVANVLNSGVLNQYEPSRWSGSVSKRCIPANLLNCHRKVKKMMWNLRIWQKPSGRRSFTRIVVNSSRASHVDVSFTGKPPQKCRSSSLSGSVNVAVSLVRRQTFDGLKLRWFISPNPNYHLTCVGWSYQEHLSTPGFLLLFSGAWGAKVINRQGHASLPSFSALPFKMPRFTSIGTFFRWKNIKPAWNTWNSMICWLSHLTSLMYLSHLVYPLLSSVEVKHVQSTHFSWALHVLEAALANFFANVQGFQG